MIKLYLIISFFISALSGPQFDRSKAIYADHDKCITAAEQVASDYDANPQITDHWEICMEIGEAI